MTGARAASRRTLPVDRRAGVQACRQPGRAARPAQDWAGGCAPRAWACPPPPCRALGSPPRPAPAQACPPRRAPAWACCQRRPPLLLPPRRPPAAVPGEGGSVGGWVGRWVGLSGHGWARTAAAAAGLRLAGRAGHAAAGAARPPAAPHRTVTLWQANATTHQAAAAAWRRAWPARGVGGSGAPKQEALGMRGGCTCQELTCGIGRSSTASVANVCAAATQLLLLLDWAGAALLRGNCGGAGRGLGVRGPGGQAPTRRQQQQQQRSGVLALAPALGVRVCGWNAEGWAQRGVPGWDHSCSPGTYSQTAPHCATAPRRMVPSRSRPLPSVCSPYRRTVPRPKPAAPRQPPPAEGGPLQHPHPPAAGHLGRTLKTSRRCASLSGGR
jgi:hypothetical protein